MRFVPMMAWLVGATFAVPAPAGADGGPKTKYATHLFYWGRAGPNQANDPPNAKSAYHPPGYLKPYEDGTWYSFENPGWWAREVRDMTRARLDYVLPVCWGDKVHFSTAKLAMLVDAIKAQRSPLKVGMYDDTAGQDAEWHMGGKAGKLPLDKENWPIFYNKWKSFFTVIPPELWATHNGEPVAKGGRPLVLTFTPQFFDRLDQADEMWAWCKAEFRKEFKFKDARGKETAVEPWLLLDWNWLGANKDCERVTDGWCIYSASIRGTRTFNVKGPTGLPYVCSNLGPGRDDRLINKPENFTPRRNGAWFTENLKKIPKDCDLAVIESWNEMYEGSAMCRMVDYPKDGGGFLPETFYIDLLRDFRGGPTSAELKQAAEDKKAAAEAKKKEADEARRAKEEARKAAAGGTAGDAGAPAGGGAASEEVPSAEKPGTLYGTVTAAGEETRPGLGRCVALTLRESAQATKVVLVSDRDAKLFEAAKAFAAGDILAVDYKITSGRRWATKAMKIGQEGARKE